MMIDGSIEMSEFDGLKQGWQKPGFFSKNPPHSGFTGLIRVLLGLMGLMGNREISFLFLFKYVIVLLYVREVLMQITA